MKRHLELHSNPFFMYFYKHIKIENETYLKPLIQNTMLTRSQLSISSSSTPAITSSGLSAKSALNEKWLQYCNNGFKLPVAKPSVEIPKDITDMPECTELYVSTKTKVLFLNQSIDEFAIFWKLPMTDYWEHKEGVLKKEIKIKSTSKEQFEYNQSFIDPAQFVKQHVIEHIENNADDFACNPAPLKGTRKRKAAVIFKDERKITIGTCTKDIMNCRSKEKKVFFNCFAIIFRIQVDQSFKEFHVKVFNTGKMEIPGVKNISLLMILKQRIIELLQPFCETKLEYLDKETNVLINSNFNCGFNIDQEKLHRIIKNKYNIESCLDLSIYPGIKNCFYFKKGEPVIRSSGKIDATDSKETVKDRKKNKKYSKLAFIIFRTGKCLITGSGNDEQALYVYDFVKSILATEYREISIGICDQKVKPKKTKPRKKTIYMTKDYYDTIICDDSVYKDGCESADVTTDNSVNIRNSCETSNAEQKETIVTRSKAKKLHLPSSEG